MDLHVVILAAGPGTRMHSGRQKVLLEANGLPLVEYALRSAAALRPTTTTVVVGVGAEAVGRHLDAWPEVNVVLQDPPRGPAHAIAKTEALLWDASGTILVLPATTPALTTADLRGSLGHHHASGADATLVLGMSQNLWGLTDVTEPFSSGDLEFGYSTEFVGAREQAGPGPASRIGWSGIAILRRESAFRLSTELIESSPQDADFIGLLDGSRTEQTTVTGWVAPDADNIRSAVSRSDLASLGRVLQRRRCQDLLQAGVSILDPETAYIGSDAVVEADSVIYQNVSIEGRTSVGAGSTLHAGTRLVDATLGAGVVVLDHTLIMSSRVEDGATVGPFAHLRPGNVVGKGAKVGNFVELKKTTLGAGSKASHLSYLGDAQIGARVNIGAGTITCNYDGVHKYPTVIEDDVFIGSDSQLVAPVTVGQGAYVAAGSSITKSVPAGALGIARGRQENKEGWVARSKEKGPSHTR